MRRFSPARALVVAILAIASSCASTDAPQAVPDSTPAPAAELDAPTTTADVVNSSAREVAPAEPIEQTPDVVEVVEPELDAEQVITATVLIASGGDLEAAIEAGIVGEAEAEAALSALESGSLDGLFD